jgi:hypothetical protein
MSRLWTAVLFAALASIAAAAGPSLYIEGEFGVEVPTLATSSEVSLTAAYSGEAGEISIEADFDATSLDELLLTAEMMLGGLDLAAELLLDVQTPSDTHLRIDVGMEVGGLDVETVFIAEVGAAGLAIEATMNEPNPVERVAFGFNLDTAFALIEPTCALPFSFATATLEFPLPCDLGSLRIEPSWISSGFDQLVVTFGPTPEILPGLRFSIDLTYTTEEKTIELVPSLSVGSSFCVTPFLQLDWDETAVRLDGLKILALDMSCEIGEVRARGILELSPGEVSLVADPYCGLFGLIWPVTGCCEEVGEGSVAFFLGDDGLFDVEAFALEAEIALLPGLTLNPKAFLRIDGTAELSLGWSYDSSCIRGGGG